ncbi:hypothetical protein ACERK3_09595 [Phycisphaerales bacterium AB-hyl4]|uniref:Uncharacterized protein n=1 Tax=Natronomicrosphaera hydrolytica TaxID=3242702 RepID=A0ABV4U6G6_9BACT
MKCPSCGQVLRAAFVRAGAVTDCARCAHRYRIKDSQIARKVLATPGGGEAGGGQGTLLPGAKELASMAGARLRVDDDGNVIGLSGLSEMMRHEGVGTPRRRSADDAPPPPGRPARTPLPTATTRLTGPRSLYMIACTLCLGLVVVGVALWHASSVAPGRAGAGAGQADLPMIMAVRLSHEPWERPGEPYDRSQQAGRAADGVRLIDTNLGMPINGQPMLSASVVTSRPDVVSRARVHVSLIDQTGMEVARTRADVAMIARDQRYRLLLPVPTDLTQSWLDLRVSSRVEVLDSVEDGRLMEGAVAMPMTNASVRGLRLLAANTETVSMRRTLFLITAMDEGGYPIMRWRAMWNRPSAPDQPIECQIIIPTLPDTPVDRWDVQMVGQPMRPERDAEHEAAEGSEP